MTVKFSGLTNIPGKTLIKTLPDPPPEPAGFYIETTTNRITSPSSSFSTAFPGSVVEDDLLILYHVTSDDVTQTILNHVPLNLLNPGAETITANWTNQVGTLFTRTSSPSPKTGSRYFWGGPTALVEAYQDVVLPAQFITEADAGDLSVNTTWWQNSRFAQDRSQMQFEFYDGFPGSIIGAKVSSPLITTSPAFTWFKKGFTTAIPPLTRTIRYIMRFVRISGGNNDSLIDDMVLNVVGSSVDGWVPLWQNVQVDDECTTSCYRRLAYETSVEQTSVTVGSNTSEQHVTFISNFGGVDQANPVNAFNNGTNGSASTAVIAPSVTTTQGSTMLYTLGAGGGYAEGGDLEPDHYLFTGGVTKRAERVVSMDGQKSTLDLSVNNFPLQFLQNAQLDTATKQSGNASLDTSIFANNQSVRTSDSPFWDLGLADFTLEAHINLIGNFNQTAILQRQSTNTNSKWSFYTDTSGRLGFSNNVFFTMSTTAVLTNTGWHHVAISRVSGVFRIFTDGILVSSSGTLRNIGTSNHLLYIARDPGTADRTFDGHVDNIHIATGNGGGGRYVNNFTPPSGLPVADAFTRILISFDAPILPFGCKGAVGTEFIPFATTTGSRTIIQDKAQAAQSGTVAIARQL